MSIAGKTLLIGKSSAASKYGSPRSLSVRDLNRRLDRLGGVNGDACYCDKDDEEYVKKVRQRFERDFLPKYGSLWRGMIETSGIPSRSSALQSHVYDGADKNFAAAKGQPLPFQSSDEAPGLPPAMNFLCAIEQRRAMTMNYCNCGCVPPVEEFGNAEHLNEIRNTGRRSPRTKQAKKANDNVDSDLVSSRKETSSISENGDESVDAYSDDGILDGCVNHGGGTTLDKSSIDVYDLPKKSMKSNPYCTVEDENGGMDDDNLLSNDRADGATEDEQSHLGEESAEKLNTERDGDGFHSSRNTVPKIGLSNLGFSSPRNDPNEYSDGNDDDTFLTAEQSSSAIPQAYGDSDNGAVPNVSRSHELGRSWSTYESEDSVTDDGGQNDTDVEEKREWTDQGSNQCPDFDSRQHVDVEVEDLVREIQTIDLVESSADDDSVEIVGELPKPVAKRPFKTTSGGTRRTMPSSFCKSRDRLKKDAFNEFNNIVFGGRLGSVEVEWSKKLNTTAGLTRLRKSYDNSTTSGTPLKRHALIELSTKVIDDEEKLRTTLLHEMIHAAVWLLDGVCKPPHGPEFKLWAKRAMASIPGVRVTTTHSYEIQFKYAWACTSPGCPFIVKRHSKSVDPSRHACGRCKGQLVEVQAHSGSMRTPKDPPQPSAYNGFVKEQSKTIRRNMLQAERARGISSPSVRQADVMKECARLWRERKSSN